MSNRKRVIVRLTLAAVVATACVGFVVYLHIYPAFTAWRRVLSRPPRVMYPPKYLTLPNGRALLWASGPRDRESGEWFDVTGSTINPQQFRFGIGKDSIPAIDEPEFVHIQHRRQLCNAGFDGDTTVIGIVGDGCAKAYPLQLMDIHELVNDQLGQVPVTVAW